MQVSIGIQLEYTKINQHKDIYSGMEHNSGMPMGNNLRKC